MNKYIIIVCALVLSGCESRAVCPLKQGDEVELVSDTTKTGTVKRINTYLSDSKDCMVWVEYTDGTRTEKETHNWNFRRININNY